MILTLVMLVIPLSSVALPVGKPPPPSTAREKRFPQAIIIGVKKGGTRALLEFLRLNPKIKAPGPEVHFFDRHYGRGTEWYRNEMPETEEGEVTIEKSPAYFVKDDVPERIKNFNPKMKLIVVLRDPVSRAVSDYTQSLSKKRRIGQLPSFERMAVGDCAPSNKTSCTEKTRGVNAEWSALRIGRYHKYLKRWLKFFPESQFHFVDGNALVSNPAEEIRKTEAFLGLDPVVKAEDFAVDAVKKFPCVKDRDSGRLHCLGKTKGRPHPHVQEKVLRRLKRFYEPENEELFKLVHRTFDWSQ